MKLHEGHLTALIKVGPAVPSGPLLFQFNGHTWSLLSPQSSELSPDLLGLLNDATNSTPKTHTGIRILAEIVLRKVDLWDSAQILSVEQAQQIPDLPDGAIE